MKEKLPTTQPKDNGVYSHLKTKEIVVLLRAHLSSLRDTFIARYEDN
ncbi:hypothetical protein [Myxosarcina sp. GI1(2024)]